MVTVLMGDIRGYSTIAESTDPSELALQLSEHRAEMNHAIFAEEGTVMQFVGDAVMACFGAPLPLEDHADRAGRRGAGMILRQRELNTRWEAEGRHPFGIGIGVSTGPVAAALLGSEERVEYTLVGDTVNLAQRLQDLARPAGRVVLNETTCAAMRVVARVRRSRRTVGQGAERGGARLPHRHRGDHIMSCRAGSASSGGRSSHGGSARRSSPRVRRCARCAVSTSRSSPESSSR